MKKDKYSVHDELVRKYWYLLDCIKDMEHIYYEIDYASKLILNGIEIYPDIEDYVISTKYEIDDLKEFIQIVIEELERIIEKENI